MKLSIIIPVYNAEKYIEECLKSLQTCNIADTEFILLNDGSTDNSEVFCTKFLKKDSRFKLINKDNSGVSSTRNRGLAEAQGEYIFFLDSDDYLVADAFEMIAQAMAEDNDFTAFTYTILWDNGKEQDEFMSLNGTIRCEDLSKLYELAYSDSCLNTCWGKIFKKSIIDDNSIIFDENLPIGEDYKFVAEYVQYVNSSLLINKSIIKYRQHESSAMRRYNMSDRMRDNDILYYFQKELVEKMIVQKKLDKSFIYKMNNYYLRVLTNLCREFANRDTSINDMAILRESSSTELILSGVKIEWLGMLKRFEYRLISGSRYRLIALYFRIKGRL